MYSECSYSPEDKSLQFWKWERLSSSMTLTFIRSVNYIVMKYCAYTRAHSISCFPLLPTLSPVRICCAWVLQRTPHRSIPTMQQKTEEEAQEFTPYSKKENNQRMMSYNDIKQHETHYTCQPVAVYTVHV